MVGERVKACSGRSSCEPSTVVETLPFRSLFLFSLPLHLLCMERNNIFLAHLSLIHIVSSCSTTRWQEYHACLVRRICYRSQSRPRVLLAGLRQLPLRRRPAHEAAVPRNVFLPEERIGKEVVARWGPCRLLLVLVGSCTIFVWMYLACYYSVVLRWGESRRTAGKPYAVRKN